MKLGRPSPAMIVALVALFFAMSGFGMAAKSMITGKEIKDGTVTSRDLAKGAVKARNLGKGAVKARNLARGVVTSRNLAQGAVTAPILAPGAVTSATLAPNAVTSPKLADGSVTPRAVSATVCPNGVVVFSGSCPVIPDPSMNRYGRASNVSSNQAYLDCFIRSPVPLQSTSRHPSLQPDLGPDTGIEIPQKGVYRITVNGTWAAGAGTARLLQVFKILGPGPSAGQSVFLDAVGGPPAESGETSQSLSIDVFLEAADTLEVGSATCGADVPLEKLSIGVVKQAAAE